ncbi:hypothetical protein Nepgr_026502 [Nepenthes gracilis]|uniref:Uncharacterized protein n=1 Tax=Nepenthes gracilis TaxID=150966 RepID=A0AAD3Y250_NEPGR|nr:hypothetical protein Nepgr_026502 [Nepenthes gracilis]
MPPTSSATCPLLMSRLTIGPRSPCPYVIQGVLVPPLGHDAPCPGHLRSPRTCQSPQDSLSDSRSPGHVSLWEE